MKSDPLLGRSSAISACASYKTISGPSASGGHASAARTKDSIWEDCSAMTDIWRPWTPSRTCPPCGKESGGDNFAFICMTKSERERCFTPLTSRNASRFWILWNRLTVSSHLSPPSLTTSNALEYGLNARRSCNESTLIPRVRVGRCLRRWKAFDKTNQDSDYCIDQTAEPVFITILGIITDRVERGHRQLFLYIMRYYREIMPGSTRIELKGKRKGIKGIYIPEAPIKAAWCRFAALADRPGFPSTEFTSLNCWDEGNVNIPSERAQPGKLDKRRSGYAFDLAYEQSRNALFLDDVHSADKSRGRGVAPFFVRRSTYLAFLGHSSFPGQTAPRTPPTCAVGENPQDTYDESMSE